MGEGTASLLKAMPHLEIQTFCILPPQSLVVGVSRLVGGAWGVGGHGTSDDTKYSTSSTFLAIEMASNDPCYAPQCPRGRIARPAVTIRMPYKSPRKQLRSAGRHALLVIR